MAAAGVIGSLKIWSHFENTRFEVIITLLRSQRFGQQCKEHFHLRPIVLDVADVIQREALEVVEAFEPAGEPEISLGIEEMLDEACD
jgi:short-subunit dehydrogenase involved in D-alanine esterification of teichoic acids